jgi:hypothetical protein
MTTFAARMSILILLAVSPACQGHSKAVDARQAEQRFWTAQEEKEFQDCMPETLAAWKDWNFTQEQLRKVAEDSCLVTEEHTRWLRMHPQIDPKAEDKAKMQACLHANAATINGTRDEFRRAFDECESEAYGLR